jgi:hypothetical protein
MHTEPPSEVWQNNEIRGSSYGFSTNREIAARFLREWRLKVKMASQLPLRFLSSLWCTHIAPPV